jgi:MFS superfamily sulfate permease-like transporter
MEIERQGATVWTTLLENSSLALLFIAGTSLIAWVWWPLGLVYLGYCFLSIFLFLAWVCPYCAHYAARTCPSGYHLIPVKPTKPQAGKTFARQYKRNIAVMFPVWFLPPVAGLYLLIVRPSWLAVALTVLFCLHGFVILPYISRQHNCKYCDNTECPRWKGKKPTEDGP